MSSDHRITSDPVQSNRLHPDQQDMMIAFDGVPTGVFGPSREPDARRLGLTLCAASAALTIALTAIALL